MYCYNPYMQYNPYDAYVPAGQDFMYAMDDCKPDYMMKDCFKPYQVEKERMCVKVPEVIGRNYCQVLLEQEIPFAPGYPALEIKEITKEVRELILSVCPNKVLINGKLHKNISYKTLDNVGKYKCNCSDIDIAYGDVRHVAVDIPFSGYVEIPGAMPGDQVEVEFAGVEECCELDMLLDPYFPKCSKVPVFKKLKEKVIVKIDLKVLRPVQITVDPSRPNICL